MKNEKKEYLVSYIDKYWIFDNRIFSGIFDI